MTQPACARDPTNDTRPHREYKKKKAELEAEADKIEVVAVSKTEDRRPPPTETIELVDAGAFG
jgi:hypothetical protein